MLRLRAGTGAANNNTFSGTTTVVEGTLIVNGVLTDTARQAGGVGGRSRRRAGRERQRSATVRPAPTTGVINGSITVAVRRHSGSGRRATGLHAR